MDRERMIGALAGAVVGEEVWDVEGVGRGLRRVMVGYRYRVGRLARRVVGAFVERPGYGEVVAFLRGDAGLGRALARGRERGDGAARMGDRPVGLRGVVIPTLETVGEVAAWMGVAVGRLEWRGDVAGRNRKQGAGLWNYEYRWVEKRGGAGARLLEIPRAELKRMQRRVLEEILDRVPAHAAAHGFRKGRSIVTNAAVHCGKAGVLRMDLADFFSSVTAARVFGIFATLGYPAAVARVLTGLCTTETPAVVWERRPGARVGAEFERWERLRARHLPQGAPTSPALANLAAMRMDRRLSGLARAAGAAYTRYADDLAFSGDAEFVRGWKRFEAWVGAVAGEEGFAVNHRKTRMMRAGVRQRVAGVVVNVRPNVEREEYELLKAILTNCVRRGARGENREGVADFRAHLAGRVAQVGAVHAGRGAKLRGLLERVDWT